jgi:hypothetical protein
MHRYLCMYVCMYTHTYISAYAHRHIIQTLHTTNCDTLNSEEHAVAFAMATHQRLGSLSAFASLQPELVQRIVSRNLRRTELGAAAIRALLLHPRLEARWSVAGYICESRCTHTHTHTHTHIRRCVSRTATHPVNSSFSARAASHAHRQIDRQTDTRLQTSDEQVKGRVKDSVHRFLSLRRSTVVCRCVDTV